jgi:predicted NBD/HSP70 family sugar kinase
MRELTGLHPNLIGTSIRKLMRAGLLREDSTAAVGAGRPRVPLTINECGRSVIGLSLVPGEVRQHRLDLRGRPLIEKELVVATKPATVIARASKLLADAMDPKVLAVGVSVTGFVDLEERKILFSSAAPSKSGISLQPLYDAAGRVPLLLDNDMHALSVRWLVNHGNDSEDTLLIALDDGRLGASMLIGGKPNRGCVTAANELGHTRLNVDTDRCFCGQIGCLERIFSSGQLRRLGEGRSLAEVIADTSEHSAALGEILDHLAGGLANAVNFMRPARLVLASHFASNQYFMAGLLKRVGSRLLPGLVDRVRMETWEQSFAQSAEVAAWLALAYFFEASWTSNGNGAQVIER